MPKNGSKGGKQDRSTLYGVFAIVALLPTAFSVAFEHSARGVSSVQPWISALFPFVLLVAARFIPPVWQRSRAGAWALVTVAAVAGGLFCWHLSGLLGFLGVTSVMRFIAPVVIAVMYGLFGALMGHLRSRTTTRPNPGRGESPAVMVRERVGR